MNKITLMLAGLCLCGAAMAQGTTPSVPGSNTAVVIKKTPVYSAESNYQLLIVPVKGFDITGADQNKPVEIAGMFPPSAYDGYIITTLGESPATYECDGSKWGESDTDNPTLAAGTIFWLKKPSTSGATISASLSAFGAVTPLTDTATTLADDSIVICGSHNESTIDWSSTGGQVIPLGNSTSDAISFSQIPTSVNAQLFRIKAGSTDYELYRVLWNDDTNERTWHKRIVTQQDGAAPNTSWVPVESTDSIPAAEAFYYYAP